MPKDSFPYIGITGFIDRREVSKALSHFPLRPLTGYKLMVGVLMSSKTMKGLANRWPGRYPRVEEVRKIIMAHSSALNLAHYNTDDPSTLFSQMIEVQKEAGPNLHGFQLNIAWPPVRDLEEWYDHFGEEKYLVLQIGGRAMEEMGNDPERIADKVGEYLPMIDYVLIDPSGGYGRIFDPVQALAVLKAIDSRGYRLRLGIAGGFGPNSLDHLVPIARAFRGTICTDAEGKLRTPQPEDRLDLFASGAYLAQMAQVLRDAKQFSSRR